MPYFDLRPRFGLFVAQAAKIIQTWGLVTELIPGSQTTPTWTAPHPHYVDDPEIAEFSWRAFDLTGERAQRDALIWNSIIYEMPIRPRAPVDSFLVDYERGLMLHIYDDRGLDVFATDPMTVLSVYQEFNDWLLDYDRPRIDAR
jgi:hypothetical protein